LEEARAHRIILMTQFHSWKTGRAVPALDLDFDSKHQRRLGSDARVVVALRREEKRRGRRRRRKKWWGRRRRRKKWWQRTRRGREQSR